MQLAPVASPFLQIAPSFAAVSSAPDVPLARIAPAGAPAPLEGAIDGAARVAAPLVDFPGVEAGQVFDLVKGSKVGPLGVKGEATITSFAPDRASFHIEAGRFGFKVNVDVEIVQVDATTVRISSTGRGVPNMSELGRVVQTRTNFAEFEQVSDPSKHTTITSDGNGHVSIDTVVPTVGSAHLELQRR